MKPVTSADPLSRLRALSERTPSLPTPATAVLGDATQRVVPGHFEQLLREAVAGVRNALSGLEAEKDPLARHLGLQALAREVAASGLDPQQLTRADEQQYVRQLVQELAGQAAQSQAQLDTAARADLEVLIRFEEGRHRRQRAVEEREAVSLDEAARRATAEQCRRDFEERARSLVGPPPKPRPLWLRLMGAVLAVASCAWLTIALGQPSLRAVPPQLPPWRWPVALAALALAVVGGWLSLDPNWRRMWLQSQLQRLTARKLTASESAKHAGQALARALALFEKVDEECRQEEAAALAVLQRRPGVQRYLRTTGPLPPERKRT